MKTGAGSVSQKKMEHDKISSDLCSVSGCRQPILKSKLGLTTHPGMLNFASSKTSSDLHYFVFQ